MRPTSSSSRKAWTKRVGLVLGYITGVLCLSISVLFGKSYYIDGSAGKAQTAGKGMGLKSVPILEVNTCVIAFLGCYFMAGCGIALLGVSCYGTVLHKWRYHGDTPKKCKLLSRSDLAALTAPELQSQTNRQMITILIQNPRH